MSFPFSGRISAFALALAGLATLIFLALLPFTARSLQVEEGHVASQTIIAPHNISFVSAALTSKRRDDAAAAVQDLLTFDPSVAANQQTQLNAVLARIRSILQDASLSPPARGAALTRIDKLDLSEGSIGLLENMDPADFADIETESRRALAAIFEQSIPASAVTETRERSSTYVVPSLSRDKSTLIGEIIRPFIVTNLVVDKTRTDAARTAARAGVAPVKVTFAEGQTIVERGSVVTPEAKEALIQAGLAGNPWQAETLGAGALLAFVAALAIVAGVYAFHPAASAQQMVAIALAVALPVFAMKLFLPLILPDDERHFLTYLMPMAATSMLLAGLISVEVALLCAIAVALLAAFGTVLLLDVSIVGFASTLDLVRIVLVTGLSSAAGAFAVRNAERLTQFLLGGFLVGLSTISVLAATWLIDPGRELNDLGWMLLVSGGNAALSGFLSVGIFVTLGSIFGVTTRLQLLEMSQLSQPLLLRLQDEAPSTFQHSVIVANLAEKGAHVIGADSLLARVGCYYHDIGKLARPGFFIENQLGGSNPHDALDPGDSARIISDHVNDGLALARQYKLPAKVAAFIPEHHGTRLVTFFYRRAAEEDSSVDPENFRYPGPKPQSRETAIAMLADSCEAAVRSSPDHSPERIDGLVEEVFGERLAEGQLDESDLTLRNIRALVASFKSTLKAVYHPRIEYPAPTEAEMLVRRLPYRVSGHE